MSGELKQLILSYPPLYSDAEIVAVVFAETSQVVRVEIVREIREQALIEFMHVNGIGA